MHGGLALHTLLPLTHTHTHTRSNLPPRTYTQLKLTELKGSGWNRLVVPSTANTHPLAKRWERWQCPVSTNVYSTGRLKCQKIGYVDQWRLTPSKPKYALLVRSNFCYVEAKYVDIRKCVVQSAA